MRLQNEPVCERCGSEREHAQSGVIELSTSDLPAFCPNPAMPLWASHPRIFLDVVHQREAMCPYCGTRYRLKDNGRVVDRECDAHRLDQQRETHASHSAIGSQPPVAQLTHFPENPNMAADALGNTSMELMTRWLRRCL